MIFDYKSLKRAASEGQRLGNWNGKAVFAASAVQLQNLESGVYYILYDDENKIVAKTQNGWKSYGEVSESGSVNDYSSPRKYTMTYSTSGMRYSSEPVPEAVAKVSSNPYIPGYKVDERPVGDVKTTIDVEKTLKMAREMTVESLLEGFLPGVNYDVAKG